jgi:hypothetical protein
MSLTFEQYPVKVGDMIPVATNFTPILPFVINKSSISGLFYYKFIMEVRVTDASGTLLGKIKQRKGSATAGVTNVKTIFDVRDLVNSQLETQICDSLNPTRPIHRLGVNDPTEVFGINDTQLLTIYVKVYEEYSSSATQPPQEEIGGAINHSLYYTPASLNLNTERGTTYFQGTAFQVFQLKNSVGRFLSDVAKTTNRFGYPSAPTVSGRRNYVRTTDYHTVAFLNGTTAFDSNPVVINVSYYDKPATLLSSSDFANNPTTGGATPALGPNDKQKLLYFASGPANLEAQDVTVARPSNNSGWSYYTVTAFDALPSSAGTAHSDTYYFIKDDDNCKGFQIRRLAWRNSLGAWDYFNFKMKSTQTVNIKRNTYEKMIGNFGDSLYNYDNFRGGVETRETTARVSETLNTDFLVAEEVTLLENLMMSTHVQIVENDYTTYTVPVTIKDSSYIRKTGENNKVQMQYTIKIEYANPLNTNS